jgi:hypothetical protein
MQASDHLHGLATLPLGKKRSVTVGWMGPRASMDAANRITLPAINPYSSAMQSVARAYTEWGIPAPSFGESDGNKFINGKFVWLQPGNAAYS